MANDLVAVYAALKPVFAGCAKKLAVKADGAGGYVLETKSPSPFPQHKGQPLYFGGLRMGKGYVSLYLMPLYMCAPLNEQVPPELKKRRRGKSCFNFKTVPEKAQLAELKALAKVCLEDWAGRKWL